MRISWSPTSTSRKGHRAPSHGTAPSSEQTLLLTDLAVGLGMRDVQESLALALEPAGFKSRLC